jgi:hypothetical protein
MLPANPDPTLIFASDGATILGLRLGARADGSPVLLDAAGVPLALWEVELLRWPLEPKPGCGAAVICPAGPQSRNRSATARTDPPRSTLSSNYK